MTKKAKAAAKQPKIEPIGAEMSEDDQATEPGTTSGQLDWVQTALQGEVEDLRATSAAHGAQLNQILAMLTKLTMATTVAGQPGPTAVNRDSQADQAGMAADVLNVKDASLKEFKLWRKQWVNNAKVHRLSAFPRDVQVYSLVSALGPHATRVAETQSSIDLDSDSSTVEIILEGLAKYYRHQRNVAVDRVKFRQRKQDPGESFYHFRFALEEDADDADLCPHCRGDQIVTQVMIGIRDEKARQDLLNENPFPTVARTIDICQSVEIATKNQETLSSGQVTRIGVHRETGCFLYALTDVLPDSGAGANLMGLRDLDKLNIHRQDLINRGYVLYGANGTIINTLGRVRARVQYGTIQAEVTFIITDEYVRTIINLKTCQDLGIIHKEFPRPLVGTVSKRQTSCGRADVSTLIHEFQDVFDNGENALVPMDGPPMVIELGKAAKPNYVKGPRPIPFANRNKVKEKFDSLEEREVITKVNEPTEWCHGMSVGNFPVLVHTITALEGRLPLVKSMELVDELQEKLTLEPFAEKLKTVLKKNPGLDKMRKVAKVLKGSQEDFEGNDPNTTANLANAPMVTCDVERTFSALRDLNTPKRARLSEEHIKDVLIIQWNLLDNISIQSADELLAGVQSHNNYLTLKFCNSANVCCETGMIYGFGRNELHIVPGNNLAGCHSLKFNQGIITSAEVKVSGNDKFIGEHITLNFLGGFQRAGFFGSVLRLYLHGDRGFLPFRVLCDDRFQGVIEGVSRLLSLCEFGGQFHPQLFCARLDRRCRHLHSRPYLLHLSPVPSSVPVDVFLECLKIGWHDGSTTLYFAGEFLSSFLRILVSGQPYTRPQQTVPH
eukprot:snap_masked-scaffold486_size158769-processed-gene-0.14 protein:Tk09326 transcript:snap_masked-scaffold486_size158769-processed-gene-0.14-mRNA-1 annotation:"hypothetical protein DAPPUDRAFT_258391"